MLSGRGLDFLAGRLPLVIERFVAVGFSRLSLSHWAALVCLGRCALSRVIFAGA